MTVADSVTETEAESETETVTGSVSVEAHGCAMGAPCGFHGDSMDAQCGFQIYSCAQRVLALRLGVEGCAARKRMRSGCWVVEWGAKALGPRVVFVPGCFWKWAADARALIP